MNITSLDQISKTRPLYIYGASSYGQRTLQGLIDAGYRNVVGFIDTYRSGMFEGLPVHRFVDYVGDYDENDQILVASSYYGEIEIRLLSYGIIDYLVDPNHVIQEIAPETYNSKLIARYYISDEEQFDREGGWGEVGDISYCFSLNVWGADFLSLFTSVALPSMLSPNNLPALAARARVRLYLFMRRHEAEPFIASPLFALLRRTVDVTLTYITVPKPPADTEAAIRAKYGILYNLYMYYYRTVQAREPNAVLGFLSPDMLASDGYISNAARRIEEGYRAVQAPEIVVEAGRFLALMPHRPKDALDLSITARELTGLAFRSLHRCYEIDFVNAVPFHQRACRYLWPVAGEGALLYTFHMHHLLIWPRKSVSSFKSGFDHDFLIRVLDEDDRIYAPTDSDEMVHVNITPWHANDPTIPQFDASVMAPFLSGLLHSDAQRVLFRQPCRLHYTPCTEDAWAATEEQSRDVVAQLIEVAAAITSRQAG